MDTFKHKKRVHALPLTEQLKHLPGISSDRAETGVRRGEKANVKYLKYCHQSKTTQICARHSLEYAGLFVTPI